jgi:hypothetical protein
MQSPDIKIAEAIEEYKLMINFVNGEEKIFDLKPYLNFPVFKPLQNRDEFENFEVIDGTIEWKCGADLSIDTFYIESVSLNSTSHIAR